MSALNPAHAIHVYTHDSIGLGEDGPTHQPVEHLASLRYIPNNDVWRPGDAVESAVSWKAAITRKDGPSCLIFSRQNLQHQPRSAEQIKLIERGGYVLADAQGGTPDVILIATGSEVGLAVEAKQTLDAAGLKTRVVSMPSTDVFDRQDAAYRDSVLPNAVRKRVAVEAGVTGFWRKYVGLMAMSSAWIPSAPRHRPISCMRTSRSLPSTWWPQRRRCSALIRVAKTPAKAGVFVCGGCPNAPRFAHSRCDVSISRAAWPAEGAPASLATLHVARICAIRCERFLQRWIGAPQASGRSPSQQYASRGMRHCRNPGGRRVARCMCNRNGCAGGPAQGGANARGHARHV